jgi:hypothetical protein
LVEKVSSIRRRMVEDPDPVSLRHPHPNPSPFAKGEGRAGSDSV